MVSDDTAGVERARNLVTLSGDTMIRLIGPGGAGKSSIGAVLARLLALPFLDLDRSFVEEHGDIDRFIGSHGYHPYARANVEVYRAIMSDQHDGVLALSSGFMTYAPTIHPQYADLRCDIERSTTTFVLLPSLDLETRVAEIVRRLAMLKLTAAAATLEDWLCAAVTFREVITNRAVVVKLTIRTHRSYAVASYRYGGAAHFPRPSGHRTG